MDELTEMAHAEAQAKVAACKTNEELAKLLSDTPDGPHRRLLKRYAFWRLYSAGPAVKAPDEPNPFPNGPKTGRFKFGN